MVQQLRCHNFAAKGAGSVPGQEAKIPQAVWHDQKKKKKIYIIDQWNRIESPEINPYLPMYLWSTEI